MKELLFLIPPSETKDSENLRDDTLTNVFDSLSFPTLNFLRKEIIDEIYNFNSYSDNLLSKIFEVKPKSVPGVLEYYADFKNAGIKNVMDVYKGTMFKSILYSSFDEKSKNYFDSHFIIFSALYGILKPFDEIAVYKLKPESELKKIGKLYKFWHSEITKFLNDFSSKYIIIDLLTTSYRKMYDVKKVKTLKVNFYENNKSSLKNIGHFSKDPRGILINKICTESLTSVEDFKKITDFDFDYSGGSELKVILK